MQKKNVPPKQRLKKIKYGFSCIKLSLTQPEERGMATEMQKVVRH